MTCESIRQLLLDLGLDEPSRRRVADALAHLEGCQACRAAFGDFDDLTAALRGAALPDADDAEASDLSDPSGATTPPDPADPAGAPPPGGWGAFEYRMQAAVASRHRRPFRPSPAGPGPARAIRPIRPVRVRRIAPIFGSLAAAVLVGWAGFRLGRQGVPPAVVPPVTPVSFAPVAGPLGPDEVAQKVRAFGEVNQVFDGQTNWLLLGSDNSDLGLSARAPAAQAPTTAQTPTPAPAPESGRKILLVRLNLARGADVVSSADLLIVAGTTATVQVRTRHGTPLRYHVVTSATDPMRVAVRVEMPNKSDPGGEAAGAAVAVLGTSLQLQPYHDANAGRLVTDRGAYDLKVAAVPSALPEGKL